MPSKYAFLIEKYDHFYRYPEQYRMKPFKIFGNLYFVGNADVGSYLIDTGDGLILIDTTYPTTRALLVQSIWEAGFNPGEIKYILHTHGHFDHFGGTQFIVSLSGAKTFLGAPDAEMFRQRPEMALISDTRYTYLELFTPDVELKDGDIISLGKTSIRAIATPGHTMGVMTYIFDVADGKEIHTAGLYGGIGVNTLCRDFIDNYGNMNYRNFYLDSLEKVRGEKVDILLGNHTEQNSTKKKYEEMRDNPAEKNPFIQPHEWNDFLDFATELFNRMLRDEEDGTDQI
ncbi:MBL fold metallo-hydrolase [Marispirochaeta aestuarii]|uniref:MBL fold metallo-hydrolase n=1 Tax=Marispirochaeta aestuarii TaxID=1963862 RepID=UPI002ABE0630|nr:MBL fold metallo-hydrolase [Marispirochaeta aestuarii]